MLRFQSNGARSLQTSSHKNISGRRVFRRLTVPDHRELAKGTLRALIREAGITVEEFGALLRA